MLKPYRSLSVVALLFAITSCSSASDEKYYRMHPSKIAAAVKQCQREAPEDAACRRLQSLQQQIMGLAYELQASPQAFGSKILHNQQAIQDTKAKLKQALAVKDQQTVASLNDELKTQQMKNKQYLAVVRWLESPES